MLCRLSKSSEREWPSSSASRMERLEGIEDNREWSILLKAKDREARADCIQVAGRSKSPEKFLRRKFWVDNVSWLVEKSEPGRGSWVGS